MNEIKEEFSINNQNKSKLNSNNVNVNRVQTLKKLESTENIFQLQKKKIAERLKIFKEESMLKIPKTKDLNKIFTFNDPSNELDIENYHFAEFYSEEMNHEESPFVRDIWFGLNLKQDPAGIKIKNNLFKHKMQINSLK